MRIPPWLLEWVETTRWRLVQHGIARYPGLSQRERNDAVQMAIYHLLFSRLAAARGWQADDQFLFSTDGAGAGEPLWRTVHGLDLPLCPSECSALPVEILGQLHEYFLGHVIQWTADQRVVIEANLEVQKAGGVFYTPAPIVDYIVRHTVGQRLHDLCMSVIRPPVPELAILDPACGCGMFLLGAYQYLLDWHRDWHLRNGPDRHPRELYQGTDGGWYLTLAEKKRLARHHIFGVDIDPQAVQVAKMSLWLKMLQGESRDSLARQRRLGYDCDPLDLSGNIQCGNSLIGPDFRIGHHHAITDATARHWMNVFDWRQAFASLRTRDHFDVVIGNPPWGQKSITADMRLKNYLRATYPSSAGIFDLFRPFVEQGIRLLADGGWFGMVLPDIVLLKNYTATRRYLLENLRLERIDWWGMTFTDAVIDAATIIGSKQPTSMNHLIQVASHDADTPFSQQIPQADFWTNPRYMFNLYLTPYKRMVLEQLKLFPTLGDYFELHEGVHSGNMRRELFIDRPMNETCRELYFGRGELTPYRLCWNGRYLHLAAVPTTKTRQRYANLGKPDWHEREKLLVRRTGDQVLAAVDRHCRYASNNFFLVFPKRDYWLTLDGLCALLNSRFMTWYFRAIEPRQGRVFAELKIKHLATFPLPRSKEACQTLNQRGVQRATLAARLTDNRAPLDVRQAIDDLNRAIEMVVRDTFGLPENGTEDFTHERKPGSILRG
ncbi:MAG: Eco57I restriction-modification methylase domain-containing protein [Gemmataceae bacterium]